MTTATPAAARPSAWITVPAAQRILGIGLPIVGGMMSQNVLDMVDTIMVGHLGENALAAVGIASFANFMAAALLIGLAAGVQAVVARRKGEGRTGELAIPLNGGLLFAFVGGVMISVGGMVLAPTLFPVLVAGNEAVAAEGTPYFIARLAGVLAIALNFSFRGYWYGISETGTYFRIIVTMHVANILISYVLIFGAGPIPAFGTLGAGLGTTIALYIGTVLYVLTTLRNARPNGFLKRLPRGQTFRSLVSLSVPTAVQTLLFAAGLTTLFAIAAQVGPTALAVSTILVNLTKLAVLPAMGMGFAAMTLVSQSLGERDPDAAGRWAWQTAQLAAVIVLIVMVVLSLLPREVLSIFTNDTAVIEAGILPLRVAACVLIAEVLATVLLNSLNGAGAARTAMIVNVGTQWLVGLPLAYLFAVTLGFGVTGMWVGFGIFRIASATILTVIWLQGSWKTIKL